MGETRIALISGGSRGIGRASALRLARDGFDISFCYRSAEGAADEVAKEIAALGRRVLPVQADVSRASQTRAWVARTEQELGPVDVVVASAGITRDRPLVLMTDEDWEDVMRTNVGGVFHLCRAAVHGMMKRRSGAILTISSVAGVYGNPAQSNYASAKAGIIGFTRSLAKEVGRYGIRANAVAPGLISTDMTGELSEKVLSRLTEAIALRRFGRPEEVADLVAFLASDSATYITGSVIEIHGGIAI
ncbi:MAG TPA: 3-oxoacyl-[acyl-carrier-protein] reductase [Trebonia sp.]|jgi:3-oxoacyl-[acyl-carrier protein] reductase|nr:3-oxoacyl-[acyl-carrier-protein] reductase [Trebonia sp.]